MFNEYGLSPQETMPPVPQICAECGEKITDEYYFYIGGNYYCEHCIDEARKVNEEVYG